MTVILLDTRCSSAGLCTGALSLIVAAWLQPSISRQVVVHTSLALHKDMMVSTWNKNNERWTMFFKCRFHISMLWWTFNIFENLIWPKVTAGGVLVNLEEVSGPVVTSQRSGYTRIEGHRTHFMKKWLSKGFVFSHFRGVDLQDRDATSFQMNYLHWLWAHKTLLSLW